MTPRLFLACFFCCLAAGAHAQADFVLHNGRMYTMHDARPRAQALAVGGGRILTVGTDAEVLAAYPDADGWPDGGWRPQERLTRTEVLRAFTIDAAYAAFQENEIGSIAPGKRADFVILSLDIMTVSDDRLLDARVLQTYLDGRRIYAAGGESNKPR